jgi:polysaccharide biosynthesis protein PslH
MTPSALWVARDVPFPLDSGDKVYTARMSQSLAEAGVVVTQIAHANPDGTSAPTDWPVRSVVVGGGKIGTARALWSRQPLSSSVHPTRAYRTQLVELLASHWDLIVIDQLGSAWTLPLLLDYRRRHPEVRLVYLSHNHEATLWQGMVERAQGSPLKKIAIWQNALKVRRIERELLGSVDWVTTITDEDAQRYAKDCAATPHLVMTPGYSGPVRAERVLTDRLERQVILVGSFRWVVKQENLRQFLAEAEPRFREAGIRLDVVGDVPSKLRAELEPGLSATRLHGFVDNLGVLTDRARIAVVPELIGGGFKLKFLDYFFSRLPVATIQDAAAGLPEALRANLLQYADLESLVSGIIESVDQLERLNRMQSEAFRLAQALYRWEDRGIALRDQVLRTEATGVQV